MLAAYACDTRRRSHGRQLAERVCPRSSVNGYLPLWAGDASRLGWTDIRSSSRHRAVIRWWAPVRHRLPHIADHVEGPGIGDTAWRPCFSTGSLWSRLSGSGSGRLSTGCSSFAACSRQASAGRCANGGLTHLWWAGAGRAAWADCETRSYMAHYGLYRAK